MPDDIRGWLTEALARRTRHPALEQTLFRQLEQFERGPLEQLGELVRAVVEELRISQHLLADQAQDVQALQQTVASLTSRLDELAGRVPAAPAPAAGHVLLLSTVEGYRLLERPGDPPALGDRVERGGRSYEVLCRNASPFPGDPRPSYLAL